MCESTAASEDGAIRWLPRLFISPTPSVCAAQVLSGAGAQMCSLRVRLRFSVAPRPTLNQKKMSSPARQHEQGSASASPSLAYYRSILMPDVIEVIGVQVRGSIIAEHLHIDVHSDIGSGPSSSQAL